MNEALETVAIAEPPRSVTCGPETATSRALAAALGALLPKRDDIGREILIIDQNGHPQTPPRLTSRRLGVLRSTEGGTAPLVVFLPKLGLSRVTRCLDTPGVISPAVGPEKWVLECLKHLTEPLGDETTRGPVLDAEKCLSLLARVNGEERSGPAAAVLKDLVTGESLPVFKAWLNTPGHEECSWPTFFYGLLTVSDNVDLFLHDV